MSRQFLLAAMERAALEPGYDKDCVWLYDRNRLSRRAKWELTGRIDDATPFPNDQEGRKRILRLFKILRFIKQKASYGYNAYKPVIYLVELEYNERLGRTDRVPRRKVWPLSPLEALAECADAS